MNPTDRVNEIMVITERLATLLARENDALKNRRNSELTTLLDEKATLGRIYETRVQPLKDNPDFLKEVEPELRDKLKTMGLKIAKLMEENGRLLKVAIEANRRVIDMIAEAVRESAPSAGVYSAAGKTDMPGKQGSAKSPAFSLNQTL